MAFSFGNGAGASSSTASKPAFSFNTPAAGSNSTPAKPTGFSFGAPAASSSTPAGGTGGGLFGQPAASTTPAPAAGGGLFSGFGQASNNAQSSGTPAAQQPASGGFSFSGFGAKPAATTSTPAPSGGLFGNLGSSNTANNAQQQQNKPTFSFGNPAASTSSAPTLNFGASTSQTQQTTQPFGQSSLTAAPGLQTSQNSTNSAITKSTKYEDLPEPARKMIEDIETYIQGRHAIYDSLSALRQPSTSDSSSSLGSEISQTTALLRTLSVEFSALSNHLSHDARATQDLRSRFEQSLRDTVKAVQIVDAVRAPQGQQQQIQGQQSVQGFGQSQPGMAGQQQSQPGQAGRPHPAFLQEFFRRKAEDLARRLAVYKSSLEAVQSQLSALPSSESAASSEKVKAILPTLRSQHAATLQLAARLSGLEANAGELKDEYRSLWRERTGSVRDPFDERRREVLGNEVATVEALGGMSLR